MRKKLIISAVICICMIFILPGSYSAPNPKQFINDLPWAYETTHSWEITPMEGCVIPYTAFERINGVDVTFNRNKTLLTMTKGAKKIVVNLVDKDYIIFGDRQIYVKVYEFRNDIYWLPAETVCNYFGLTLDIYKYGDTDKESVIRISDDTAEKTLPELIELYNPNLIPKEDPIKEEEIIPEPPIGDRLIFLTFEGDLSSYTTEIMTILDEYNMKAAFFLVGGSLVENLDILRSLIVDGHTIGLHTMTHNEANYNRDINTLIDEFNAENELLYKLTKQKTRLCRAPDGSSTNRFFIDEATGKALRKLGYIVWDWNVNMVGMPYENAVAGIKRNEIPVFRFEMDESTVELLPQILDFITENPQFKVKQITESAEEVNFIGRFR
jgi:Predicted xylanase/chitin deacetylase